MKKIEYSMDKHGSMWEVWAKYPNGVIALICVCADSVWAARISLAMEDAPADKQEMYAAGFTTRIDGVDHVSKTYEELKAEKISKVDKFMARALPVGDLPDGTKIEASSLGVPGGKLVVGGRK